MHIIALSLALLFTALSIIHVYWGLGGTWAGRITLPKKEDSSLVFTPGIVSCLIVAALLLLIAYLCLSQVAFVPQLLPPQWIRLSLIIISIGFFIRTIGDFKYVGLTKKIKNTDFAKMDTRIYTPLCFLCGTLIFLLAL